MVGKHHGDLAQLRDARAFGTANEIGQVAFGLGEAGQGPEEPEVLLIAPGAPGDEGDTLQGLEVGAALFWNVLRAVAPEVLGAL